MKLKIFIENNYALNCLEACITPMAALYGRNYELMFSESWGFKFDEASLDADSCLGTRIDLNEGKIEELLLQYHGIKLNFNDEDDPGKIYALVEKELQAGNPSLLLIDTYWCPWFKTDYQKTHSPHYCLVIGIDKPGNLICIDNRHSEREGSILPISDFEQGYHYSYITFSLQGEENFDKSFDSLLLGSIGRLKGTNTQKSIFDQIRAFGQHIESNGLDYKKETSVDIEPVLKILNDSYSYGNSANQMDQLNRYLRQFGFQLETYEYPIYDMINKIMKGRRKYSEFLNFVARYYHNEGLLFFVERLKKASDHWNSIYGMLVKASYMPDPTSITKRIAAKIIDAAVDEEDIMTGLEKFITEDHLVMKTRIPVQDSAILRSAPIDKFEFVDLGAAFNNKGFSNKLNSNHAEFCNGGKFFLDTQIPEKRVWIVENMKFMFPDIVKTAFDNVSCNNQEIMLKPGNYKYIMYLGCADIGNHTELIKVKYENGEIISVPVELTSWQYPKPNFSEITAWTGEGAVDQETVITVLPYPVHLYAGINQLEDRGMAVSMILPENPNMHLFAISLGN